MALFLPRFCCHADDIRKKNNRPDNEVGLNGLPVAQYPLLITINQTLQNHYRLVNLLWKIKSLTWLWCEQWSRRKAPRFWWSTLSTLIKVFIYCDLNLEWIRNVTVAVWVSMIRLLWQIAHHWLNNEIRSQDGWFSLPLLVSRCKAVPSRSLSLSLDLPFALAVASAILSSLLDPPYLRILLQSSLDCLFTLQFKKMQFTFGN